MQPAPLLQTESPQAATIHSASPIGRLIVERSRELNVTLAELSRRIARNQTYLHQFVKRGSPRHLHEQDVLHLARELGVAPERLRAVPLDPGAAGPPNAAIPDDDGIPTYLDTQRFGAGALRRRVKPLYSALGPADYAIWLTRQRSRFHAGDLLFVQRDHPIRFGDHVLVTRNGTLAGIGFVVDMPTTGIRINEGGIENSFFLADVTILRIIGLGML